MVGHAVGEATGRKQKKRSKSDVSDREVVVLGSGNLGLVYLMEAAAAAHARGDRRASPRADPGAAPAIRTSAGCSCARPSTAPSSSGPPASATSSTTGSRARTRSPRSRPPRRRTSCAPTASPHVADLMVGSFYDPVLDEGCAFEELISFHGGLGGPQTRPFILYPPRARRCPPSRSSAPRPCTRCSPAGAPPSRPTALRRPGQRRCRPRPDGHPRVPGLGGRILDQ